MITLFQLAVLYADWQIRLRSGMDYQRFGQYVVNTKFTGDVDSDLFYEEDPKKAYDIILERYCEEYING